MIGKNGTPWQTTARCRTAKALLPRVLPFSKLFVMAVVLIAFILSSAAAAVISVHVNPLTGDDSRCAGTLICRTIAHAVQRVGASQVNLSAGVFNESTVSITNVALLVISGVPSSTVFDCSRRLGRTTGPSFDITNSTVTITGVTFQHCSNVNENGGAVSAVDSSISLSQCAFFNCSAANGGAVSSTGRVAALFLFIQNSNFSSNSAIGGLVGCPTGNYPGEPCSTWGGAISAFDVDTVRITGCILTANTAIAVLPIGSPQSESSRNAIAGGGCVSVLFHGNTSAVSLQISGNSMLRCAVKVPNSSNILVGNGAFIPRLSVHLFLLLKLNRCAGYGGALSVYFGLSAGLRLLVISFFSLALQNNVFANCGVSVDVEGGNSYGGGVSLYIGGYSSVFSSNGAAAAVGDTLVRNISVTLDTARFHSCSAIRNGTASYP
jgi:hypothetical protein